MTSAEQVFDADTTTDELLEGADLSGTVVLVTGASAGIGLETTRALATHGATVIAAVRNVAKAEAALAEVGIGAVHDVTIEEVDLASLASVRAFTDRITGAYDHLDLLIANAGLMACPQGKTADGFDLQFGTNHLGHFVLVNRLVPLVLAAGSGRIVVLSSSAHRSGEVDLDDPNFETTPYNEWAAYGRSKTANAQFAAELDRRLASKGVRAASVHPGAVDTELFRHLDDDGTELVKKTIQHMKQPDTGAATTIWVALVADADEIGGRWNEDCHVGVLNDSNERGGVKSYVYDPEKAAALWALSEDLVGERFSW
jgi:NAD(P)-dependent dehydrogenase (short-subunit alcohol dehydrogenase family)